MDIGETINQRVQFQEEYRQRKISAAVEKAALELGSKNVRNSEPDDDWTAHLFGEIKKVSSVQMQSRWAKVLSGEIERPKSVSIKTLICLERP